MTTIVEGLQNATDAVTAAAAAYVAAANNLLARENAAIVAAGGVPGSNPNELLDTIRKLSKGVGSTLAGIKTYSAPAGIILAAADCGRLTNLNQAVRTVTLPPVSSVNVGDILTLINSTPGYDVTLLAAPGDTIFPGNGAFLTSVQLGYTEDVILYAADQASANDTSGPRWSALSGSMHTRNTSQFASALGTTGYKKFADGSSPTGFITEQWGLTTISAGANTLQTVTLPLTFPNAIMSVGASVPSTGVYGGASGLSQSQIQVWASNNGVVVNWRAYGY